MPAPKTSFKALDYFEKFHCIGSACEANCCNSWTILIDKKSYAKYRQIDEDNGTDFFKHVAAKDDHGVISLNAEGNCPYLADDKLCGMYKNYGESILSVVCKIYPRNSRFIQHASTQYMFAVLSCPQVMRLAILRKKRLRFLDLGQPRQIIPGQRTYEGSERSGEHNQVLDAVHEAFVHLAQQYETSLNTRMAAMLLLCSHAGKLDPLHNAEGALTMLQETLQVKNTGFIDIPDLPGDIGNQFKIFVLFTTKIVFLKQAKQKGSPSLQKLFAIIDQSFAGFGLNSYANVTDEHFSRYAQAQSQLIKPYFDAHPHIWENLLSHYLLTTDFPFNKNQAPLYNLIYLGMIFLFCRGLLAGYVLQQGKVSDADFVHVFHTVFREIDHNPQSAEIFNTFAAEIEANSIGQIYTILAY
jgi:lysine-N-methylase